jgi:hypothetical protein
LRKEFRQRGKEDENMPHLGAFFFDEAFYQETW